MPPAKRALKLEKLITEKVPATSSLKGKKNGISFSPITGTRLISPFSSPRSNHVEEQRNGLSNENREPSKNLPIQSHRKEQHQMENNDKLLILQSEVEHSLERFLKIRKNLVNLQALEGTRELDNILGISDKSGNLKSEVRKTRKLIEQVRKRKLQKWNAVRLSAQGYCLEFSGGLPFRYSPGLTLLDFPVQPRSARCCIS
ncbi:centromere protein R isoform X1 [Python bivittatus]|uniref:Centromere protein R isoform X1 n=1 Tax=Python bivittatus TaxID=176946 RepID=A0A9F5J7C7_PYTBI|nr:centromere protein R isoform X1 [Python bivittatus]